MSTSEFDLAARHEAEQLHAIHCDPDKVKALLLRVIVPAAARQLEQAGRLDFVELLAAVLRARPDTLEEVLTTMAERERVTRRSTAASLRMARAMN